MALKPCRECKKQVSTEAKTCPHCGINNPAPVTTAGGEPSRKDKLIGIGIFFALIAGAITMCSDSEDEKAAAAKQAAEAKAACAKDLQCAGDQGVISAGIVCPREIEKLAKNSMKWTDGTLEPKFSKFRWANKDQTAITFLGDRAQFQNGFGAYVNVVYECDMTSDMATLLAVRVREGRL